MIVGDAAVRLRPESGGFAKEADSDLSNELPGVAKKAAGFFAAAFAAVKIGGFLKDSILEASDLGESTSKVGVVFGDASAQVLEFADNASSAFGQSRAQALEAAGTFGNLLRSLGMTEQASADMSTSFVGLASDLASFNNTDPAEALDALRAGLTGETEPLKRYGINLNAAAIEQEAVRLGLSATGKDLSAAAKAQASYSLIMQQSTLAQGDFARTSAGLANQQRIIASQFTDLQANIGGLFVPIVGNAATILTGKLMPALLNVTSALPDLGADLGTLGDYFREGLGTFTGDELAVSLTGVGGTLQFAAQQAGIFGAIFGEAMADGKAGAELLAQDGIEGLAARAGVAAFAIRDSLGGVWDGLVAGLSPVIGPVLAQLSGAFSTIGDTIGAAFGGGGGGGGLATFADLIGSLAEGALPLIIDYFTRWADVVAAVIPIIVQVLQGLVPVIADIFAQIGPVLQQLAPIIGQVAGLFAGTLLTVIQALAPVIPPLVTAIGQVASVLAGAFLSVLQAIAPVLPVIARVIGQVAEMLAGALASAIQALVPILPPIIEAFAQIAVVLVGALMGALQAILPVIPTLVGALLALVQAAILPLLPLLPMLASLLMTVITALAPLIPPIIQLVVVIVQLVVAAIMPLLPLLPTVIGLFTLLMNILLPVIQVVIGVVGAFIGMATTVASVVIGFVSTIIGVFTGFWSGVTGIVSKIAGGVIGGFTGLRDGIVGLFSGIATTVGGFFEGIGGAVKTAINAVIRGINNTVIGGLNLVIDGVNVVNPFNDIPHVPKIPTFHAGGIFTDPSGEGIALLRDQELIATPEQRRVADDLLRGLLDGRLPAGAELGVAGAGGLTINEHIYQTDSEPPAALAARVTQGVVWNLNGGITRQAPTTETAGV